VLVNGSLDQIMIAVGPVDRKAMVPTRFNGQRAAPDSLIL
jgi:hypothetical protein